MNNNTELVKYGNILFLIGILIAVIGALFFFQGNLKTIIFSTLIVIGIGIGILNITKKEVNSFLISTLSIMILLIPLITIETPHGIVGINIISLLVFTGVGLDGQKLFTILQDLSSNIIALILPSMIIVAMKTYISIAKD